MTRKRNNKPVAQRKLDMNERVVTFEGSEAFSSNVKSYSEIVSGEAQKLINKLVGHIEEVSFGATVITGIKCYLKQGKNQQFYFLWADSVRVRPKKSSKNPLLKFYQKNHRNRPLSLQKETGENSKRHSSEGKKKSQGAVKTPPIITYPASSVFFLIYS